MSCVAAQRLAGYAKNANPPYIGLPHAIITISTAIGFELRYGDVVTVLQDGRLLIWQAPVKSIDFKRRYLTMKQLIAVLLAVATAVTMSGCASNLSGDSYSRDEARMPQQVQYATVQQVRLVKIEGTKTPIGAGAGAVIGGVAGSTAGGGRGSTIAAAAGAVAGGLLGAAAEEGITREQGVEVTVRYDNGQSVAIVQAVSKDETFNVGDKVRVLTVNGNTRVSH
jgi:outer membrane lipoprotein SlyB